MKLILLGSGSSLRGYQFDGTRPVLAINSAAWWSRVTCSLFSADQLWIERNEWRIRRSNRPITLAWANEPPVWDEPRITWVARRRCNGFAADGVNGSTSGFAALNWAVRCGAKRILLLGYDYRSHGPYRHWYDEEEPTEPGRAVDLWPQWIAPFNEALPELQALGVQVMNASPESAITAFPKCTIDEGLKWFDG